jgi:hypothetical protein
MSMIEYLSAFRLYKADVLLLALGVTLVTSLLKKTVLKNCSKKLYLFIPFVVGLLFYCVYAMIAARSFLPLTKELTTTVEGGFACGCAATLYYVTYEQFFRMKKYPLSTLLEGYVSEEKQEEVAQRLSEESNSIPKDELYAYVQQTLAEYAKEDVTEEELSLAAKTIAEVLLKLRGE